MIWISPPYDADKVSIVSVTEPIQKQARYIRQSGPDHFAIIDFVIEPCEGHIGFKNEAIIQEDLRGNKKWEQQFPILICYIYDAVKKFIEFQYDKNIAIGNFIFKLTNLEIRSGSSRFADYGLATLYGLSEIFVNKDADE